MDTSYDHSSETLNFLLGDGTKMSTPTDQDLAQLLFAIASELHADGILADVIGNHPLNSAGNYLFDRGIHIDSKIYELYQQQVRAREVLVSFQRGVCSRFYIACSRKEVYWLLIEDHPTERSDQYKFYQYAILDVESMTKCFADCEHYADPIGLQIVWKLLGYFDKELKARREKLDRMTESFVTLKVTTKRIQSALTTLRAEGTGIEG